MTTLTETAKPKPAVMFRRWMEVVGIPLAALVFAALYLMPTPSGLSTSGQMSLAIFMMALVLWVTQAIPTYAHRSWVWCSWF
jgi:di/tricarboxylate transporter